ncbi:MAG TPA: DUF1365 domain-containing protein [Stellaceae bacterium]|nr:DUF1365 domain-containing protein [Stellaceae bacterium]
MSGSALYFGTVTHQRLRPVRHELSYRVFSLLVDLDELPDLARRLRLLSHNRFNLFSFHDRDHGARRDRRLRPYVEAQLARAGIALDGGAIRLLCFPRVLGYVFNPLSIYFCHGPDAALRAILYEVSNTFGEQHSYLIPVTGPGGVVSQSCAKEFYVSPFMEMACRYEFRLAAPGEKIAVYIRQSDREGPILHASLAGTRAELSDRALIGAFLSYPLMTLKVIGGIHWEALRLWRKGLKVLPHPAPPTDPVTICQPAEP